VTRSVPSGRFLTFDLLLNASRSGLSSALRISAIRHNCERVGNILWELNKKIWTLQMCPQKWPEYGFFGNQRNTWIVNTFLGAHFVKAINGKIWSLWRETFAQTWVPNSAKRLYIVQRSRESNPKQQVFRKPARIRNFFAREEFLNKCCRGRLTGLQICVGEGLY